MVNFIQEGNRDPAQSMFCANLLAWGALYGRKNLPWQVTDAYAVWVSEVMLQQTQVETVRTKYLMFMAAFPTVGHLAQASLDEVNALWSGLGYYARAKNLWVGAQKIVQDGWPTNRLEWEALPGVGRSTAAALCSFCLNQPEAICDGNVQRVLSRVFAIDDAIDQTVGKKKMWILAESCASQTNPGAYTQAIMDLGATLCTPKNPNCEQCPQKNNCIARATHTIEDFPVKKNKAKKGKEVDWSWLLLCSKTGFWVQKNQEETGVWKGLWVIPQLEIGLDGKEPRAGRKIGALSMKHIFSHFVAHIECEIRTLNKKETALLSARDGEWHAWADLNKLGLPTPVSKVLAHAQCLLTKKQRLAQRPAQSDRSL